MSIDNNFYGYGKKIKIKDLVKTVCSENKKVKAVLKNVQNQSISSASTLKNSKFNDLAFLDNPKYINFLKNSNAGCIILNKAVYEKTYLKSPLIVCENPRRFFALCLTHLFDKKFKSTQLNIIHKSSTISEGVVIGNGVEIKENVFIGPNSVIGDSVKINSNSIIGSNCCISYSIIGRNCEIYSGVRIGTSGFGFEFDEKGVVKFPHLGRVIIGNNVEIGANSTVDRGSLDDTVIDDFVMIDNLVHIGHNVEIGKSSIICGQTGISGSTKLGANVLVGPQVGFAGHLQIESGSIFTARSGVTKSINSPIKMGGFPAIPFNDFKRQQMYLRRLTKQSKGSKIDK